MQITTNHVLYGDLRPEAPPEAQLPVPTNVDLVPYKALMTSCWAQVQCGVFPTLLL